MSSSYTHRNETRLKMDQNLVQDATLLRQIGKGFVGGRLYKAREKDRTATVAIKVVEFSTDVEWDDVAREGAISAELKHENIIQTHKYYVKENFLIIHMEYLKGTNLRDYILERGSVDSVQAQNITEAVHRALAYMHAKNITHGDIHQGNVMMDGKGRIKLIDFGCARKHVDGSVVIEECKRDISQLKRFEDVLLRDDLKYSLEY